MTSGSAASRRRCFRRSRCRLVTTIVLTGMIAAACTPSNSADSAGASPESSSQSPSKVSSPAPDTTYRVPADGVQTVAGVRLPAGARIYPRDSSGAVTSGPTAWLTTIPTMQAATTWHDLATAFPTTGLWPVITNGLRGDTTRPWVQGETGPAATASNMNVEQWFRGRDGDTRSERYGPPFTALAVGSEPARPPWGTDFTWAEIPSSITTGLLLVPVDRPADVPAALGWAGAINAGVTDVDLSSVLRSWEDRFGMTVTAVGFDTIDLVVTRPPRDAAGCRTLGKEIVLLDPDLVANSSFVDVADAICDAGQLSLHWD